MHMYIMYMHMYIPESMRVHVHVYHRERGDTEQRGSSIRCSEMLSSSLMTAGPPPAVDGCQILRGLVEELSGLKYAAPSHTDMLPLCVCVCVCVSYLQSICTGMQERVRCRTQAEDRLDDITT